MQANRDVTLLFVTRIARLFAYGFLSVVLVLYLVQAGLTTGRIGLLLTLTLAGDTLVSLAVTATADRLGRRRMLVIGAALMVFAGVSFAFTQSFTLLLIAATLGVISPSGSEIGPFLSIEQAALSQLVFAERRTLIFAWYNLVGSFATATGSLAGGTLTQLFLDRGFTELASYRVIVIAYAAMGIVLGLLFALLTRAVEAERTFLTTSENTKTFYQLIGLPNSGPVVVRLAALFSVDAFAGGLVLQSVIAYWFHVRFGLQAATLGAIFFGGNILAGISALAASWLARQIGLIKTMVFTHIPSNILLMLVPLMPTSTLAIAMLLLRFSISQMDVPTRQAYTMAIVDPEERSAAGGVTAVARSAGSSLAPAIAGRMISASWFGAPFFVAGLLKIAYDLTLYRSFQRCPVATAPRTDPRAQRAR